MSFWGILLLAIGEAMDSVAVAAAAGVAVRELRARHVIAAAAVFGGFQALMPVVGYGLGTLIGPTIATWGHWVVFGILTVLGLLALREALDDDDDKLDADVFGAKRLLLLGIATSIDAFGVGVALPVMGAPLLLSAVTIGVVSAVFSGAAVVIGHRLGAAFGKKMEVLGGLVLIVVGVFFLVDHLWVR